MYGVLLTFMCLTYTYNLRFSTLWELACCCESSYVQLYLGSHFKIKYNDMTVTLIYRILTFGNLGY